MISQYIKAWSQGDGLCGLVVRVSGYRSRGPGFDYRQYQIFWEVVGPLSLGPEIREYGCGDPLCWPHDTFYPRKSPTSGSHLAGIVRSQTKTTEFVLFYEARGQCFRRPTKWLKDCSILCVLVVIFMVQWQWLW
jgi:hypothetical protein